MKVSAYRGGIAPALALLGPLLVYFVTVSQDLGSIDSGELAAACAGLGIAHPTGYPLYTMLGRLAFLLIPAAPAIARLNVLSSSFGALSALSAFYLFRGIARRTRPDAPAASADLLALGAAWLWAIHPALWSQATGNEVHALQAALIPALLALAQSDGVRRGDLRVPLLSMYAVGLAFTNHMSVVYLAPGLIAGVLLDPGSRAILRRPRTLALFCGAAAVPLTLYLYLPIRAAHGPIQDWGNPTSLARFIRHVGGAQYRVWMFTSSGAFQANLAAFAHEVTHPPSWIVLAAALFGAVRLARRDRPTFARLVLGFIVGTIWASGYSIPDLEPYFLIPRICLAGLAFAGVTAALPGRTGARSATQAARFPARWRAGLVALPLAAAVVLAGVRWHSQSRAGDHFIRLYAGSVLDALPPHAILISRHWDIVVSPCLYLQQVENRRRDVTIVDTELLRRIWYFDVLRRADPTLLAPIEDRVSAFLGDLRLFEAGRPYDPQSIEEHYRAVIAGIFEAHHAARPVFATPDAEQTFYPGRAGIPEALFVRIVDDPSKAPPASPVDPSVWIAHLRYVDESVRRDAWAFPIEMGRSRIRFLHDFGREEEARAWQDAVNRLQAVTLPADTDPYPKERQ